jgi:enoyl-CoA hydratase/carnithine racemase
VAARVRFDVGDDRLGEVVLTRPDKLNAMDWALFEQLHDAARAARAAIAEGRCRAVLVRGEGRAFSAGLDVSLFAEQAAAGLPEDARISWLQQAFTGLEDLPVPVVGALRGVTIGAGCQLALACHLRVAAPDLRMGLLEVRWALIPDLGGTYRLPRLVGLSRATDLCITGRQVDAATAASWGLVDAVLDDDDFEAAARAYALRLAGGPTTATGALPRLLRESLASDRDSALAAERRVQMDCLRSDDFGAAVAAATKGRSAAFNGR